MSIDDEYLLRATPFFRIEHSRGLRIAGLLFVSPIRPVRTLAELDDAELAALGPTLRLATRALEAVVRPLNIYCAKFGETPGPLHFHVFPRSAALTAEYLDDCRQDGPIIDAPRLVSWSYRTFSPPSGRSYGDIAETIRLLRRYLDSTN